MKESPIYKNLAIDRNLNAQIHVQAI